MLVCALERIVCFSLQHDEDGVGTRTGRGTGRPVLGHSGHQNKSKPARWFPEKKTTNITTPPNLHPPSHFLIHGACPRNNELLHTFDFPLACTRSGVSFDIVAISILVSALFSEPDLEASKSNLTTSDVHSYVAAWTSKPGFACLARQTVTIGAHRDGAKSRANGSWIPQR